MYVVGKSWVDALAKWKQFVAVENEMDADDVEEPNGIALVCEYDELIADEVIIG
jgi:hypothetical protein